MYGSNKFSASVTSGVLMSLFLHSRVADSRMARASETVMVFATQKVCHAAKDVAARWLPLTRVCHPYLWDGSGGETLRSCRVFSSIISCMCVISRQTSVVIQIQGVKKEIHLSRGNGPQNSRKNRGEQRR